MRDDREDLANAVGVCLCRGCQCNWLKCGCGW